MGLWFKGHDGGGYEKLDLVSFSVLGFGLHVCLLRCREGTEIKKHKDNCIGRSQYKMGICLQEAIEGGKFGCENLVLNTRRVKVYRADTCCHKVEPVVTGQRVDLLVGFNFWL